MVLVAMLLIVANIVLVGLLLILSCCYLSSIKRRSDLDDQEDLTEPGIMYHQTVSDGSLGVAPCPDQPATVSQWLATHTPLDPPPSYEQAVSLNL